MRCRKQSHARPTRLASGRSRLRRLLRKPWSNPSAGTTCEARLALTRRASRPDHRGSRQVRGTGMRLSLATLDRLRPAVRRQKFDPRALGIGIAHLGCGHFLRGHQAYITQHAIEAGGPDAMRWGLAAASLITPRVRNALAPQDGLFSVLIRDGDYTTPEIVGTLREIVFAPE